ncbi:cytochrome c [Achromobacter sp. JUb104]|uniref:c-type cytochrome n=1 Tax=Achromobacter sp. JUb104 TaxID=2940590 RepID=UPI002168DBCB|nr:cytochrome c [Achromobacter sp. JUb104]MCS3507503.1 nicotinate dehydrogenase subunit B [Achromobacter sp. JUb104]
MSSDTLALPHHHAGLPAALPADLLHGVALRPPSVLWDGARYRGSVLQHAQLDQARGLAGVVMAVQRTHFAGVVAVSPVHARQAAVALAPVWHAPDAVQTPRADAADPDQIRYGMRLPSSEPRAGARATAWVLNGHASVWLPACTPATQAQVRRELAALLQQAEDTISVTVDGAVSEGQDAVHPLDLMDAAADAALLSQAVGRPVCVACQSGVADELVLRVPVTDAESASVAFDAVASNAFASNAAASNAALSSASTLTPQPASVADGRVAALLSDASWAVRPSLARLLSQPGQASASAHATVSGDSVGSSRRALPPLRASVDELNAAQVFAQESQWHEAALAQDKDPIAWRLEHLPEGKGRDLARQVIDRATSRAADAPAPRVGLLHGTGFATAQVQCVDDDGAARMVWSAWVAEVSVQPQTGHVDVTRVVAGHDSQHLHPAQAASMQAEIEQQTPWLLANARRLLAGPPAFDDWTSPSQQDDAETAIALRRDAGGDGMVQRDATANALDGVVKQGQLAVDGVVTLPAAAAIANAIHNATGVRLRQAPFDTESLRLALADQRPVRGRGVLARGWMWLAAGMAGLAGVAAALWPLKPALPLTAGPDVSLYSMRAIERGRLVAAAGDCIACHTAPGGKANAGGLALDTPFGTIYTTNITPDNDTGIGRWSYPAFERAMRQGVHQDGRQLYPAFPYTAYAKLSDADMQALYGYLMSQPAVKSEPPKTELAFPFNMRPLLAGWNALFHDATPFTPDPSRSAQWLRGAYLVEGVGHCAACHSPRNRLGAEKKGVHYLAGGEAEGWTAPALNQLATGPRAWTGDELFQYLRTGYSPSHGVAAGPMAPVIHGLAELPDSDVKAITTYLLDLPKPKGEREVVPVAPVAPASPSPAASRSPSPSPSPASSLSPAAATAPSPAPAAATIQSLQGRRANGERIYQNACAVCHEAGSGPTLFGAKPLLSANTNLHAATPDNLIQVILRGIQEPADDALGYMPGFKDSLDDKQVADLLGYLRERFAPDEDAWPDPTTTIKRLRNHAELN